MGKDNYRKKNRYNTDAQKFSVNHISVELKMDSSNKISIGSIHFSGDDVSEIFQSFSEIETTKKFTIGSRPIISFEKFHLTNSFTINAYTLLKKYGKVRLLNILDIVCEKVQKLTPSFSSIRTQFIEDIQSRVLSEKEMIKFGSVVDNKKIDFSSINQDNPAIQEEKLKSELIQLYGILHNAFLKVLFEATNNNKIPLFITGEGHTEKKSLLVEVILLILAKKYAFKNLAMEITEKSLKKIISPSKLFQFLESTIQRNFPFIHKIATNQGMTIIPAEGCFQSWDSELREKNMLNALKKLTEPTIFITGALHLNYFLSKKESLSNFECIFINAANAPQSMKELFGEKILDSQFVIQAVINTELDKLSPENLIDICYGALEKINESCEIQNLIKLNFLNKISKITETEKRNSTEDLTTNFQSNPSLTEIDKSKFL